MAGALNWFLSDLNLNLIPGFVSRKNCFFIVEFVRKLMLNRFQKMYPWNASFFWVVPHFSSSWQAQLEREIFSPCFASRQLFSWCEDETIRML